MNYEFTTHFWTFYYNLILTGGCLHLFMPSFIYFWYWCKMITNLFSYFRATRDQATTLQLKVKHCLFKCCRVIKLAYSSIWRWFGLGFGVFLGEGRWHFIWLNWKKRSDHLSELMLFIHLCNTNCFICVKHI